MVDDKGRLIDPRKAEILKCKILDLLTDEEIEVLGIEVEIRLKNGYQDKVWYAWKNPLPST
ncbi:MAG: hypothetical protein OXH56_03070 [Gemmatimonadetes bacterium]|nr:hypothetical protein [Gemmatimonadota bacterium]